MNVTIQLFENINQRLTQLEKHVLVVPHTTYSDYATKTNSLINELKKESEEDEKYIEENKIIRNRISEKLDDLYQSLTGKSITEFLKETKDMSDKSNVDDQTPSFKDLLELPYREAAIYADDVCKETKPNDKDLLILLNNLESDNWTYYSKWNRTSYANLCYILENIDISTQHHYKLNYCLCQFRAYYKEVNP